MKIKVCGMRDKGNIMAVDKTPVDFMGFIFYPKSRRFVGDDFVIPQLSGEVKKVGVFVNHNINELLYLCTTHSLDYVQLHGNEDASYVQELSEHGVKIIKAIGIKDGCPFEALKSFQLYVDFFLFDTATQQYGGSGQKFNWQVLNEYTLETPYFLSGGIGSDDLGQVMHLHEKDQRLYAIDLNSRFEIQPALKNIELLKDFAIKIKTKNARSEE